MAKSNYYIFERKEVVVLLLLLVLVALLSFTMGVKLGKDLQITPLAQSVPTVDEIKQPIMQGQTQAVEKQDPPAVVEKLEAEAKGEAVPDSQGAAAKNEASALVSDPNLDNKPFAEQKKDEQLNQAILEQDVSKVQKELSDTKAFQRGVYTLQVGSFRSMADAEKQRATILRQGYQALVVQVELPGKGTWYRVTVGTFDTENDAKKRGQEIKSVLPNLSFIVQRLDK